MQKIKLLLQDMVLFESSCLSAGISDLKIYLYVST